MPTDKLERHARPLYPILMRITQAIDAADDARPMLRAQPCDIAAKQQRARQKLSELLEAIKRREQLGLHFAYLPCHALPDANRWERGGEETLEVHARGIL